MPTPMSLRSSVAPLLALVLLGALGCGRTRPTAAPAVPEAAPVAIAGAAERDAIFASSDLPEPQAEPLPGDPMEVTIHRLSNGMTVYISPDRSAPRFTGRIAVRAGSRHDPPNSTGLAHYLEHMLFKGTDELGTLDAEADAVHVEKVRALYAELRESTDPAGRTAIFEAIDSETQAMARYAIPNEFDRLMATIGVEGVNAYTSDDETVYLNDVPANRLAAWAAIESEQLADPVFRLFYPELEAVYEEKNLALDSAEDRVWETLTRALMPRHPYGTQTTIGTVDHLRTPAYQDMVEFFARWYAPNNMAIVLAGDVDAATAIPVLEKSFGRLTPQPLTPPHAGEIVPLSGRTAHEVLAEGEQTVTIAWLTVPESHPDEPAIAVMDRMLDDAKVGLLNTELELSQKLQDAASFTVPLREAGYMGVQGTALEGQSLAKVESLLMGAIAKLIAGEFTDADVEAAKLHHVVDRQLRLEFAGARASLMTAAFTGHLQWADVLAREAAFAAVTRQDVLRVAARYLGEDRVVVTRRQGQPEVPKIDKPKITPVAIDPGRSSAFAKQISAMPVAPLEPEWAVEGTHYERRRLPAGDLLTSKNTRNDLFSLEYRFDRGFRKEPLLCYALELLELSGAGDADADAFQKEVYAHGATLETWCSAERSGVQISGPDARLEAVLALVDEWFAKPRLGADTLDRLHENTLSERIDGMQDDGTLVAALDAYAKYDRRSPLLQLPSNRALRQAKLGVLRSIITGVFDRQHRTTYFGPRSAEAVAPIVVRGKAHRPTGGVQIRTWRAAVAPQIYFLHKAGAKATVRFVLPGGPLPRDDRPAAEMYSEYLSGNMSALVFQEMRESRGLAYSASSVLDSGEQPKDAAGLLGFVSTQAEKLPVAIDTFLSLLRTAAIQPMRLEQAKAGLEQRYRAERIMPRWVTSWVTSWDELGEPRDPRPWQRERIAALDAVGLEAVARRFADLPVIIAVVGDRGRIDFDALRAIAPVRELEAAELFSYGEFPRVAKASDVSP